MRVPSPPSITAAANSGAWTSGCSRWPLIRLDAGDAAPRPAGRHRSL